MRTSFRWVSSLVLLGVLTACVVGPAPYEEYSIARAAIKAAQEAEGPRLAPGLWSRADQSFRQAEREYKNDEFDQAREHFVRATAYAERSENATRLKKFQTGDTPP